MFMINILRRDRLIHLKLNSSDNGQPARPVANLATYLGLEQDQGDGAVSNARLHRNDQLVDVEHQLLVTHHAHSAGQAVHIITLERETFEEGQGGGLFQGIGLGQGLGQGRVADFLRGL